jgi:hypothetical protein
MLICLPMRDGGECSVTVSRFFRLYDKPHCQVRVQLRYWSLDSWDGAEAGKFYINGVELWSQNRGAAGSCTFVCWYALLFGSCRLTRFLYTCQGPLADVRRHFPGAMGQCQVLLGPILSSGAHCKHADDRRCFDQRPTYQRRKFCFQQLGVVADTLLMLPSFRQFSSSFNKLSRMLWARLAFCGLLRLEGLRIGQTHVRQSVYSLLILYMYAGSVPYLVPCACGDNGGGVRHFAPKRVRQCRHRMRGLSRRLCEP